jgi:GNAT superfamily N-acetyltransferase
VEVTVCDARPNDAPRLAELVSQLGSPTTAAAVAVRLELLGAAESDRIVVAERDGDVVGLASLHVNQPLEYDEPAARVSAPVVDEHHRGCGIGEALVTELEPEARRRRCCLIYVTTAERRTDAQAFYRRIGFEETGWRFAKRLWVSPGRRGLRRARRHGL